MDFPLHEAASNAAAVPAEIDVGEVLNAFRSVATPVPATAPPPPASSLRSLYNRGVDELTDAQQRVISLPECPACNGTTARPRLGIERLTAQVVECTDCGLGRLHPLPSADEIAGFYPSEYYGGAGAKFTGVVETLVRLVAARQARRLAGRLPQGARVLDVGCGRGTLLSALADRGCDVHGFEVNASAAQGADPRAAIRIAADLAAAKYDAASFDQVILWHVLEHVADPLGTVREIRRILKPGGEIVVAVPNFSSWQARWAGAAWFHLDLPRHLYHFPVGALRTMLEQAGFRCESEHHLSLRQNPYGWVQSWLNRRPSLPRNGLYELLHHRSSKSRPFDGLTRMLLRAAFIMGMPIGLAIELAASACRRGATVHVVARRDPALPQAVG